MTEKKKTHLKFRVKEILAHKEMTTTEFAVKADLHYNTALAIVNNKYQRIGLDTLAKMCLALDVEVSQLFDWE